MELLEYLIKKIGDANIIFSNSDIIIKDEKYIKLLSSTLKEDIVVVGPVINEHGNLNRGWRMPSANSEILFNLPLISRYFKKKKLLYKEEHYKDDISIVDVVSGCFFIVSSKFLREVDYFDENTFLYYEEQIFAKKVKDKGKKELVSNKVVIIHDHSVSVDNSLNRLKKQKTLKESQRYFAKNYLKANTIQMALLYITDYFYRVILFFRCLVRR